MVRGVLLSQPLQTYNPLIPPAALRYDYQPSQTDFTTQQTCNAIECMLIGTHKEDKVHFAHLHYTETPCKVPTP